MEKNDDVKRMLMDMEMNMEFIKREKNIRKLGHKPHITLKKKHRPKKGSYAKFVEFDGKSGLH